MRYNKKGQVTIFIILGIVIVVGILFAVYFASNVDIDSPSKLGPEIFIDKCVQDVVEESVSKMMRNGGEIVPSHAISYEGNEYNYLCYQADDFLPCYNTHPVLEKQIEKRIYIDTEEDVQECFNKMKTDFEMRGYDITGHDTFYSVDLLPGNVRINLTKNFNISKDGASQNFNNFNTRISSSIYDLVQIVNRIVNTESQTCSFNNGDYMSVYPKYTISAKDYEGSKIYSVSDDATSAEFLFAVRGCVL